MHGPETIRRLFRSDFERWGFDIPLSEIRRGSSGRITGSGWLIRYLVDEDDEGLFLEYYATHRMTNDSHVRIAADGTVTELDAIWEMYGYDPKVPGSKEEAETRYFEHNRRVAAELVEKGLYPAGDVNAYLRTHEVPPPAEA